MDSSRTRARLVSAFEQGHWSMVEHRARQLLPHYPEDAELHYMAGIAFLQHQRMSEALQALSRAAQLDPAQAEYVAHHAKALALLRRLVEACEAADRAMPLAQRDPFLLDMLGVIYMQANAIEPSAQAFRQAVALRPDIARFRFNLGYALTALGDIEGAEAALEACVHREPRYWRAHLSLSMLKRQTPETQHIERLKTLLEAHTNDPGAQTFLHLALGKECEDLTDYDRAFAHYAQGKAAARRTRPASTDRDKNMFDALIRAFPVTNPMPEPDAGPPAAPIFIIGMPRTGTTLLDRIISSHPDVHSVGETQHFAAALQRASGSTVALLSTTDIDAQTRNVDWTRLGEDYMASVHPVTAEPRFTDKMPHNFLYAGFIARALPHARILCLRRNPLDTCLSNFRHLFELESGYYDYSLDLLDTGRYYIQFDRLMAHWHKVLPGRIHEVSYDTLVDNPETVIREALAFCDLPWDDACLHFESNHAPVKTPKAWQVRTPIFKTARGQWKHYESHVHELHELFEREGIATDIPGI
ncbi:hypothetical protein LF63_0109045 [Oleiagrimonas soli]|nr:hypothetical protein LF63_0109045 [Oleiagrimonas soli]